MSSLSAQQDSEHEPEDEEREFLLLPGVAASAVTSGFSDVKINRLCKIVLRLAFYFFLFQLLVLIVDFSLLMSRGEGAAAGIGLIRVLGVAATLYLLACLPDYHVHDAALRHAGDFSGVFVASDHKIVLFLSVHFDINSMRVRGRIFGLHSCYFQTSPKSSHRPCHQCCVG